MQGKEFKTETQIIIPAFSIFKGYEQLHKKNI